MLLLDSIILNLIWVSIYFLQLFFHVFSSAQMNAYFIAYIPRLNMKNIIFVSRFLETYCQPFRDS